MDDIEDLIRIFLTIPIFSFLILNLGTVIGDKGYGERIAEEKMKEDWRRRYPSSVSNIYLELCTSQRYFDINIVGASNFSFRGLSFRGMNHEGRFLHKVTNMREHDKKPQYEKPVLISLNELPLQAAASCSRGSHLSGGTCRANGLVASSCSATGNHPGAGGCGKGSAAAGSWCSTGSNAGGARCSPGGNT